MNNKALYWIALGVFALGLNSEYQKGNLPLAHRVADRAQAVLCQVAARAEQTWTVAKVLSGRQDSRVDDQFLARQQAEVDRVMAEHQAELAQVLALRQSDLDRIQRRLNRVHVVMDRAQMSKLRILERTRFRLADSTASQIVICPHTGARVTVNSQPDPPDLDVNINDAQ